jgi:methionine sulfoxide reductase heme-binding subunit
MYKYEGTLKRHTLSLVLAGALLAAAAAGVGLAQGGDPHGLQLATRYTARAALLLFLLVFTASTLHAALKAGATAAMLRERRGLGLAFAAAHFIHLGFIVAFLNLTDAKAGMAVLALGSPGYVGLLALVLTSNDRAARALGPDRWRRLHTGVLWYIWLVFLLTYAKAALSQPGYGVGVTLLVAAALARLSRRSLARGPQTTAG